MIENLFLLVQIIFTAAFIFFAPGFFISLIIFDFGKIDVLERVILSIALSISLLPLLTYYANTLGFGIHLGLIVMEIITISIFCTIYYILKIYNQHSK